MAYEKSKKWGEERILARGGTPEFANTKAFRALPAEAQAAILSSMAGVTVSLVESTDGSAAFLKLVAGRTTVSMSAEKFRTVLANADLVRKALEQIEN